MVMRFASSTRLMRRRASNPGDGTQNAESARTLSDLLVFEPRRYNSQAHL